MRRLASVALAAALVLALSGTALAAKGGNGSGATTGSGSCSVTPNPVAVGSNWTMTGTGLPASTFVNVYDSDSGGTTVWMAQTSSTGTVSITWHSYYAGTSTIKVTTALAKKASTLATCSFQVT